MKVKSNVRAGALPLGGVIIPIRPIGRTRSCGGLTPIVVKPVLF
ncbi:MAG: hypothetical protein ABL925_02075 [Methylococcales bacterium]